MVKAKYFTGLICLVVLALLVVQIASAEEAKGSPTKEEVTKLLESGQFCFDLENYGHFCSSEVQKGSLKVLGVRTEGDKATIYYEFIPVKERQSSVLTEKPHHKNHARKTEKGPVVSGTLTMVRLDDGTWFFPVYGMPATK